MVGLVGDVVGAGVGRQRKAAQEGQEQQNFAEDLFEIGHANLS